MRKSLFLLMSACLFICNSLSATAGFGILITCNLANKPSITLHAKGSAGGIALPKEVKSQTYDQQKEITLNGKFLKSFHVDGYKKVDTDSRGQYDHLYLNIDADGNYTLKGSNDSSTASQAASQTDICSGTLEKKR